ncbi:MAG: tetratricopeptide repeat-containing serine protease family protein [Cyanobacteriota bacterium]|nr:tetratricopeptide repeat-containing serine protease family protein [Cyanobacteriota bacterium]
MKYLQAIAPAIISTSIVVAQPLSVKALSSAEVGKIAEEITVLIDYKDNPGNGSGVIIKKSENNYTVLTAAHVVSTPNIKYEIVTPDNQRHSIDYSTVKKLPNQIDLAVVTFTSNNNYKVAKIGNSSTSKRGTPAYLSGFPKTNRAINQSILNFTEGKITANSSQPLSDGYALVYSSNTVVGMSGGGVLNQKGELIGIHGRGDSRFNEQSDIIQKSGFNLGIPINTFVKLSSKVGVDIGDINSSASKVKSSKAEFFFARGISKRQENKFQEAISDFTEAIKSNPKYAEAFAERGVARVSLKDFSGAIEDYNQALKINPNFAYAYYARGFTRVASEDYKSAINDLNKAIEINPNHPQSYAVRGLIRNKLRNIPGAIVDLKKAGELFKQQGNDEAYEATLMFLRSIQKT